MAQDQLYFVSDSLKMPLMNLPIRATVLQLSQNRVIIISPTSNLANFRSQIDSMGEVVAIVAPNLFHHLFIPSARRIYPKAKIYGAPGFAAKRPDVNWDGFLGQDPWPYQDELAILPIAGMPKFNEIALLHRSTKTLIVTDLCFNLRQMSGFGARLVLSIFGTFNRFAVSRLFTLLIRDRRAFQASIEQLFKADFDRIVMAHGEIINENGRKRLTEALAERGLL